MAYFPPYIDSAGLHIPTYTDIRDSLVEDAKSIFGQDLYLDVDSQDYQYISAVASKVNDTFLLLQSVYNSRGPSTTGGSTLDGIVKLNGIKRKAATYSTVSLTLTGTAGTVISNGIAGDTSGNKWQLPASVTISAEGTATVTATAQNAGAVPAAPRTVTKILTPTYGWSSVNNPAAANLGSPVETDGQLRARQAISTAQPSRTVLEGLKGAIAAVPDVTRFRLYENDTNAADANGLPAHSITSVVEGGTDTNIAAAIYAKKTPGCYTNGTTVVNMMEGYVVTPIRFYRPAYVDIDVTVNIKSLSGYTTQTTLDIKTKIADYLNSLAIGVGLSVSSLWGAALSAMPSLQTPTFSITSLTAGKHGQAQGTDDITALFNEVTRGDIANITVNVA